MAKPRDDLTIIKQARHEKTGEKKKRYCVYLTDEVSEIVRREQTRTEEGKTLTVSHAISRLIERAKEKEEA